MFQKKVQKQKIHTKKLKKNYYKVKNQHKQIFNYNIACINRKKNPR